MKRIEIKKNKIIHENDRNIYFLKGKKVFRGSKKIRGGGKVGFKLSHFPENRKKFVEKDSIKRIYFIGASCWKSAKILESYGVKIIRNNHKRIALESGKR